MKKINKILLIGITVLVACALVSFVGVNTNINTNGPKITFKKQNKILPATQKIAYEDMQGLNYHSNKKITINKVNRYIATSAYKGNSYLNTSNATVSTIGHYTLTNNTTNIGASNGRRTGGINDIMAQNVSYNRYSNINIRNKGIAITSNGSTVMTGTIYGASEEHDHEAIFDNEGNISCGHDGCNATGKWVAGSGTGYMEIEWAPIGDTILPLLLFMLIYIVYRKK